MEIPAMYGEIDEGIDSNSIYGSFQREYPTFVPEESTFVSPKNDTKNSEKSIIFPQKLDLSTMRHHSPSKKGYRKKLSPIKKSGDSRLEKSPNSTEKSSKRRYQSEDLVALEKSFEAMARQYLEQSMRKNSNSSVTSDRASSVSSSSSGISQKSIFMQVCRAKELINKNKIEEKLTRNEQEKDRNGRRRGDVINIEDSDFHLSSDPNGEGDDYDEQEYEREKGGGREEQEEEEEDDTRPPSSQPSLVFEGVEQPRRAPSMGGNSNLISSRSGSKMTTKGKKTTSSSTSEKKKNRNVETMSDTVRLSDSQLVRIYDSRAPKCTRRHYSDNEVTLTEHSPVMDKTIVDEVFEDFRSKSAIGETPILRTLGANFSGVSLGSNRIEHARDATHRSASMNNIMTNQMRKPAIFDGFAPGALRHSVSTTTVSPQKLRELRAEKNYPPIPELARFVIKPSTRELFPIPLDIDALSGKGLRRDEKSSQLHFGGKSVATQIHGDRPTPRGTTIPQKSSGASRPTTASNAKKAVNFQSKPLNLPSKPRPASYCSATSSDGIAYSISTVTQQLLGTVKSLHPDWLQMMRSVLKEENENVAMEFRIAMLLEKEKIEVKFRKNRNDDPFEGGHCLAKISVINRILDRIEEMGNGHVSRIQQIKMIHSALLST